MVKWKKGGSNSQAKAAKNEKSPLLESTPAQARKAVTFHVKEEDAKGKRVLRHAESSSLVSFLQFTDSEREHALRDHKGVGPAAFLIRDAVIGLVENPAEGAYDPYENPDRGFINIVSVVCRRMCAQKLWRFVVKAAVWGLVFLTFFEPPNWCRRFDPGVNDDDEESTDLLNTGNCAHIMALVGPAADDPTQIVEYYPNTHTMWLTENQSNMLEWFFLALILLSICFGIGRDGLDMTRYLRSGPARLVRIVEIVAVFALAVSLVAAAVFDNGGARELAPFWRGAVLIAFSRESQRELKTLIGLLPEVINVLIILTITIIFYAWIGVVAFYGTEEGDVHFPNIIDAMYTLWIMSTTANYPDVMMLAYNQNRISALFFISFMVIAFFFILNVILASVVNAYDNELDRRKQERKDVNKKNLQEAFKFMDSENKGSIDRETVMALFVVLNDDFPEIRNIENHEAKLLFALLDKDGSDHISEQEFMNFGNILLLEFEEESMYRTFVQRRFPKTFKSRWYQAFSRIIKSAAFEYAIDTILLLNAIVIAIQSWPMLMGESVSDDPHVSDGAIDTVWEIFEAIFTCIYAVEAILKIVVFGWKKYIKSYRNVFDFTITIFSVAATLYVYYPNDYSDSRLIRYVVMARVLRLGRLLAAIKSLQLLIRISIDILPSAFNVLLLLLVVAYMFAAFGLQVFGGMITRNPSDPNAFLVLDTDFSDNDYWANNFNDMFSALNVLFNLLVVNNWTECADGFEAVAQSRFVRWFFVLFHVLGVILINNLVVAFIISGFIQEWDSSQEAVTREDVAGEAWIEDREAHFDGSKVTGTDTELSGNYVAKVGRRSMLSKGQQSLLRDLFTSSAHSTEELLDSNQ